MNYFIYKLKFLTPVRFGVDNFSSNLSRSTFSCKCDTLFSAICFEWLQIYGEESFNDFIEKTKNGNFLISDMFPFRKDELFLPKPRLIIDKNIDFESEPKYDKKQMKKLNFIPFSKFQSYIDFLVKDSDLDLDFNQNFTEEILTTKVNISRNMKEDNLPYTVSSQKFTDDCGLYFILQTTESLKNKLDLIIQSLGDVGIGGKRSSGYGKFELYEKVLDGNVLLSKNLDLKTPKYYMNISSVLPTEKDIDEMDNNDSFYSVIKRSGFVYSKNYKQNQVKKANVFMFSSGSCFRKKMQGSLVDVAFKNLGSHPVYKYGFGMFLGVDV